MEVGRESDEFVAVEALKWIYMDAIGIWLDEEGNCHEELPRFTTDLTAAWIIADKLKIAIIPQSDGAPKQYKYLAEYNDKPPFESGKVEAFAETPSLAICLAALKAVGYQEVKSNHE
jgi:hypothetical protein